MSLKNSFSCYVHLPYCAYKCPYCDFNAYAVAKIPEAEYLKALTEELKSYSKDPRFSGRLVNTLYFGGGTPSLFSSTAIRSFINELSLLFPVLMEEVALEANPGSISESYLKELRESGVTRLSIGAQTGNEKHLKILGRKHSREDVERSVKDARCAGINNLSVDLIFGVPDQTLKELEEDLDWIISLNTEHVSLYGLTVEPGTPLFQSVERGTIKALDSDTQAEMYELILEKLKKVGFVHYEISNFGKPGFASRHNLSYWEGRDYLGVGAGAHSYFCSYENSKRVSAERWSARANPVEYMKAASSGLSTKAWGESLKSDKLEEEFFYLGLRKIEGVSLAEFNELFGLSKFSKFDKAFDKLSSHGLLVKEGGFIRLTTKGLLLSDSVFSEFLGNS